MKRLAISLILLALSPAAARADQLIQIPTGDRAPWSGELMFRVDGTDEQYYSLRGPIGVAGEVFVRKYDNLDGHQDTELGGQMQLIPQALGLPAVSVGMWDVLNEGPQGRRAFLVVSKSITFLDDFPPVLHGTDVHVGVGTGRLGGVLFGVRRQLPAKFAFVAEYDSRRWNHGIWWEPIPPLRLRAELHNGNPFVGATLSARF